MTEQPAANTGASGPRTAAGRMLHDGLRYKGIVMLHDGFWKDTTVEDAILAIEQQAAKAPTSDDAGATPDTAALREALEVIAGINENRVTRAQADALGWLDGYLAAQAGAGEGLDVDTVKRMLDEWLPHDPIPDGWKSNVKSDCYVSRPCWIHARLQAGAGEGLDIEQLQQDGAQE